MFVGADTGFVYSLDSATGCVHWSFRANAGVRTAPTVGPGRVAGSYLLYFGDIRANVYAVDALTGTRVWHERLDQHPIARVTGAPKLAGGRLYVPLSSLEESGAGHPLYPCCTFRGGLAAYDALTGKRLWKSYTVKQEPHRLKVTSKGTQLWTPAGAGVWSSPTVDLKRRAVYVATGNGYTQPADEASDAVIAYDLDTGKRLWVKQVMAADAYVRDCPGIYRPNVPTANKSETCPDDLGPDMDFGNAPILRTLPNGRSLIVIGQKDGHAWGLDPDRKGEVVWSRQLGLGWENGGGGMMWGSAADHSQAYFPVTVTDDRLGLAAVNIASGDIAWRAKPPIGGGAPVTVIPGVVFFGSSTGTIYAFSTRDGRAIWNYDTAREFETVNGVAGARREYQCRRPRGGGRDGVCVVRLLGPGQRRERQRPPGVWRIETMTKIHRITKRNTRHAGGTLLLAIRHAARVRGRSRHPGPASWPWLAGCCSTGTRRRRSITPLS